MPQPQHPGVSSCPRRSFLRSTAFGAAGLGAAGSLGASLSGCGGDDAGSGSDPDTPPVHEGSSWEPVLAEQELPVGATADGEVSGHHLLLYRAAEDEVHAFEAVCTHEGCRVEAEQDTFRCPCHGSVFALDSGDAEAGPAREPLTHFEARRQDGSIEVRV